MALSVTLETMPTPPGRIARAGRRPSPGTPWLLSAGLWLAAVAVAPAMANETRALVLDTARSDIGFQLRTRWGQQLEGRFDAWRGEIVVLPDGRHQVRLTLPTGGVEIVGSRSYTRITRGAGFFDVERHPEVRFVSDPYPPTLAREGGAMTGVLSIRGIAQRETFRIAPAECARPAVDCDVVGEGDVRRSRYAMDRWGYALSDQVRFTLRIRAVEPH
ncbi:YceI family protein [Luteimonas sp. S4-F44]|uniref:YceI family protein n=1 Tax=Luteimonas sp. S4-F44 TaxID=2925842 RepID=UPI001F533250|nr:YceI family protein [Luteimonas sp. S4-F44]UNK42714.1 YceI family protein [Luteimonas sp. S4-F44]